MALQLFDFRSQYAHFALLLCLGSCLGQGPEPYSRVQVVDFRLDNAPTKEKRLIETMSGGVAAADFDGDGNTDIYFANGAERQTLSKSSPGFWNRMLLQKQPGRFLDATESLGLKGEGHSIGVAAADYDNDGDTDLFVAGVGAGHLYENRSKQGEPRFVATKLVSEGFLVGGAWLDYDNDGLLDLFVVSYVVWDPKSEPYCGDSLRNLRTYCHPREYPPTANRLFRNEGKGKFRDVSDESGIGGLPGKGMSAAVADYDNDGDADIFVTNDTEPNFLFENQGNGKFQEVGVERGVATNDDGKPLSSMGAAWGDFDADGKLDLSVTALSNETYPLYRNSGAQFRDVTNETRMARATLGFSGWGVAWIDVDHDGWLDLVTANGDVQTNTEQFSGRTSKQPLTWFRNASGKAFERARVFGPASQWRGLATGDFNGDGAIDLVATRLTESAVIFWGAASRKQFVLDLSSLREVERLGLVVSLELASGRSLVREFSTSGSYASSSAVGSRVSIGIGDDRVTAITVRLPGKQPKRESVSGAAFQIR